MNTLLRAALPYALAAAVAAGAAWYVQELRIDVVRADLRAERDRTAILSASNAQCAADVAETRKAVFAIKQAAEERERTAAAAVAAAESDAAAADKRAAVLAKQEPATADQCDAVDAFTLDYLRGRK